MNIYAISISTDDAPWCSKWQDFTAILFQCEVWEENRHYFCHHSSQCMFSIVVPYSKFFIWTASIWGILPSQMSICSFCSLSVPIPIHLYRVLPVMRVLERSECHSLECCLISELFSTISIVSIKLESPYRPLPLPPPHSNLHWKNPVSSCWSTTSPIYSRLFIVPSPNYLKNFMKICSCILSCNNSNRHEFHHKNKNQERRWTLKYPRLPRSVYVERVETVKQWGPWSGLGSIRYYVFCLKLMHLLWYWNWA